ncbi:OB-fold protein [Tenacibaculum platacis]|uniref:OB-fold protein n=1 Tax=Tenacibaculum platacis TaxID=3137852 RepID=UPI0031FB43A9
MIKNYRFLLKCMFVFSLVCFSFFMQACSNQNNIKEVAPRFAISSNDLLLEFAANENEASDKYVDQVIEVHGTIKEITSLNNRKTVILNTSSSSGIICDINDSEQEILNDLKKNQLIHIKGICKGYLKDVILLNCFIDIKNTDE